MVTIHQRARVFFVPVYGSLTVYTQANCPYLAALAAHNEHSLWTTLPQKEPCYPYQIRHQKIGHQNTCRIRERGGYGIHVKPTQGCFLAERHSRNVHHIAYEAYVGKGSMVAQSHHRCNQCAKTWTTKALWWCLVYTLPWTALEQTVVQELLDSALLCYRPKSIAMLLITLQSTTIAGRNLKPLFSNVDNKHRGGMRALTT